MNLFAPANKPDPGKAAGIKQWVVEALSLDDNAVVMVTELRCTEPGCPPLETVIAVMRGAGQRSQVRIHKGVADLTREEVLSQLRGIE